MPLKATANVIQYSRCKDNARYPPRFVVVSISRASHACRLHAYPPSDRSIRKSKSWLITRVIGDSLNVTDVVADVAKKKRTWTQLHLSRNRVPYPPASGGLLLSVGREPLQRPSRLVGRYTLSKHVGRRYPTGRAYHFIASPLHFARICCALREKERQGKTLLLFYGREKNLRMQISLLLLSFIGKSRGKVSKIQRWFLVRIFVRKWSAKKDRVCDFINFICINIFV